MNLQDCIDAVETMLSHTNRKFQNSHEQILYERGYLTGMLAELMMEEPRIRHNIVERVKHKK